MSDVELLARIVKNQSKLLAHYRASTPRPPGRWLEQLKADKAEAHERGLL